MRSLLCKTRIAGSPFRKDPEMYLWPIKTAVDYGKFLEPWKLEPTWMQLYPTQATTSTAPLGGKRQEAHAAEEIAEEDVLLHTHQTRRGRRT